MKRLVTAVIFIALINCLASPAFAHFGMVIPGRPIITQEQKSSGILLAFAHPFENRGMDLSKPKKFSVTAGGKTTVLLATLQTAAFMEHKAFSSSYTFAHPGVYQFVMEPEPYWEAAENLSIIHYTKVIVPAYGDDEGWNEPVGLPAEIVPMTRPFGNYAGNSFTGQVLRKGAHGWSQCRS